MDNLTLAIPFDWPLDTNLIRRHDVCHTFGLVRQRPDKSLKPHQGWDLFAPIGTPCYAVSDGVVVFAGDRGDFGKLIVLQLGEQQIYAAYAHLSEIQVDVGERVWLGEEIGKTGNSGNASNLKGEDLHLHFEIRTVPLPGLGLQGRVSPISLYQVCPLSQAVLRNGRN